MLMNNELIGSLRSVLYCESKVLSSAKAMLYVRVTSKQANGSFLS